VPIGVVIKDALPVVAAVHHMVNGAGILNAKLASHGETEISEDASTKSRYEYYIIND
jgi:hypothetical protein